MVVRTGKGDKGVTYLSFRKRVSKDSSDIQALGDLDELNSYLGFVRCNMRSKKEKDLIENIQRGIVAISSEIAIGTEKRKKFGKLLKRNDAEGIKKEVFRLEKEVSIKGNFALPGKGELSARLNIARAVARRSERSVVGLIRKDKNRNNNILCYLNCVSDILFLLAKKKEKK